MNDIRIEINNGLTMRLTQTDSDKNREGIGLEYLNQNNELELRELIPEEDFVMLINYYRYVKENNIQCDFINPHGKVQREEFESNLYSYNDDMDM